MRNIFVHLSKFSREYKYIVYKFTQNDENSAMLSLLNISFSK